MTGFAFFDVDGTLLKLTSMRDFQTFVERAHGFPKRRGPNYAAAILRHGVKLLPREVLNAVYYRQYAGCDVAELATLGAAWFQNLVQGAGPIWNTNALDRLEWHRRQKHRIVLVSGSFLPCLDPIAEHLEVADVLCARLEIADGRYTGRLLPPQTIGRGKAVAIQTFLAGQPGHDPRQLWAYGDHRSDIPMLSVAAQPVALAGDPKLETHAHRHGWAVI